MASAVPLIAEEALGWLFIRGLFGGLWVFRVCPVRGTLAGVGHRAERGQTARVAVEEESQGRDECGASAVEPPPKGVRYHRHGVYPPVVKARPRRVHRVHHR